MKRFIFTLSFANLQIQDLIFSPALNYWDRPVWFLSPKVNPSFYDSTISIPKRWLAILFQIKITSSKLLTKVFFDKEVMQLILTSIVSNNKIEIRSELKRPQH